MTFLSVLLAQLLGVLGFAVDPRGDTDRHSADITMATVRDQQGTLVYRVHVYGLHDSNEITGAPVGVADSYFNQDGVFRDGQKMPCPDFSYRHIYRKGTSIAEVRIPRACLGTVPAAPIELTLLQLDPHEVAYPVYRIADTVTIAGASS